MNKDDDAFIQRKLNIGIPKSINDNIHLISFTKQKAHIFGSYQFRFRNWASDIDLIEQINGNNEKELVQNFTKKIQQITRNIIKAPEHYYTEVKLGLDDVYSLDFFGTLDNGIMNFKKTFQANLKKYFDYNLISKEEYYKILAAQQISIIHPEKGNDVFDFIYSFFRNKRVLRWSSDEILQGFKIVREQKITIEKAIYHNTFVKIDMISNINHSFIEVTNIVVFAYLKDGKWYPINFCPEKLHTEEGLLEEIDKLYYSNKFYSPMKVCKRLFSVALIHKDYNYINDLVPILQSNISALYQIKANIEAILAVLEKAKKPPIKEINRQLDEIKVKFQSILEINRDSLKLIFQFMNDIIKEKDIKKKYDDLKFLFTNVKEIINTNAIVLMNKYHVNPPKYLPKNITYKRIIRTPDQNPLQIYKDFEKQLNDIYEKMKNE